MNPPPPPPPREPSKNWPKNQSFRFPTRRWGVGDITSRMRSQAKRLGVEISPSTRKGKKLDVYQDGRKIASIGALGYGEYDTWLQMENDGQVAPGFAAMKRNLFRSRHYRNAVEGASRLSPAYLAYMILW